MSAVANFYERLGVERSVSDDAIRNAYRALARRFHPDLHTNASPEAQAATSRRMAELSEAYEVLSNERTRAAYDRELDQGYRSDDEARWTPPRRPPPSGEQCQFCGHGPVKRVRLRRNVGLVFTRQSFGGTVTVCRGCGVALFREFQNSTLAKGWWGPIAFFVNFFTVLANTAAWFTLMNLGNPRPPATPVEVPIHRPMPPGPILLRRAGIWVAVVLFSVLASSLGHKPPPPQPVSPPTVVMPTTTVITTPVSAYPVVGECVAAKGRYITKIVSCSAKHFALIVAITQSQKDCPQLSDEYFVEGSGQHDPGKTVCLSTYG